MRGEQKPKEPLFEPHRAVYKVWKRYVYLTVELANILLNKH